MNIHILALTTIAITIHTATAAIGADDMSEELQSLASLNLNKKRGLKGPSLSSRALVDDTCEPGEDPKSLDQFPQWNDEVGYWVGELSFYGADGTPNKSASWNYRYDDYKGFITGNINGGSYRQRNIFLYPPAEEDACESSSASSGDSSASSGDEVENPVLVTGNGTCGVNGNSKRFEADQSGESCDGSIEGPFGNPPFQVDTVTTLVGNDNAVLYQINLPDYPPPSPGSGFPDFSPLSGNLVQSQLTTLSGNGRRTRTAQGFDAFNFDPASASIPIYSSFYRERRVSKEEFYDALEATLIEYNILEEDSCTRDGFGVLDPEIVGGIDACRAHLEESFEL